MYKNVILDKDSIYYGFSDYWENIILSTKLLDYKREYLYENNKLYFFLTLLLIFII